jgi:hypothetical protein
MGLFKKKIEDKLRKDLKKEFPNISEEEFEERFNFALIKEEKETEKKIVNALNNIEFKPYHQKKEDTHDNVD